MNKNVPKFTQQQAITILLVILLATFGFLFRNTKQVSERIVSEAGFAEIEAFTQISSYFEKNTGQVHQSVSYLSRSNLYNLFLTPDKAILNLSARNKDEIPKDLSEPGSLKSEECAQICLQLEEANRETEFVGINELPGKSNYLIGKNSSKWYTDIPQYEMVKCMDIYDGIELRPVIEAPFVPHQ